MKLPTLERNQRTERDFSPREEAQSTIRTLPTAPVEKTTTVPPLPPEDTAKPKHPIRRWLLPLAGVGAVIPLGGLGYRQWQYVSIHQETDNATVAGHIHPIASRITGTVAEVLVHENQWVQKGQLLVQLDPTDYQVKVAEAQANLEAAIRKAKAAEVNITFTAKTAEASATQAQGNVSGAEAAIANAQAQVTEAEAGIANAQSQVTEAQSGIANAEAQVTAAKADILKTKAQSAQSAANLQKAKLDLNRVESVGVASGATFALLPPDNATGNFTKIVQRVPVKIAFDPQSLQKQSGADYAGDVCCCRHSSQIVGNYA